MSMKGQKRRWKARYANLEKAINDRNDLERMLLLSVCVVILLFAWDGMFFNSINAESNSIASKIRTAKSEKITLATELSNVKIGLSSDPLAAIKHKRNQLRIDIANLTEEMKEITRDLVSEDEMREVVTSVLEESPEIEILKLENIEGVGLSQIDENAPATEYAMSLFKHGMSIQVKGDYFSTLGFLKKLEGLEHKLLWDTIEYTVTDYPKAQINIVVRTIGDTEGWIGV